MFVSSYFRTPESLVRRFLMNMFLSCSQMNQVFTNTWTFPHSHYDCDHQVHPEFCRRDTDKDHRHSIVSQFHRRCGHILFVKSKHQHVTPGQTWNWRPMSEKHLPETRGGRTLWWEASPLPRHTVPGNQPPVGVDQSWEVYLSPWHNLPVAFWTQWPWLSSRTVIPRDPL